MYMARIRIITILMALAMSLPSVCGNIRKIVPFTSDNDIRIEVHLNHEASELSARISACHNGETLWQGDILQMGHFSADDSTFVCRIGNLAPDLWSPANPSLYNLEIGCDGEFMHTRIGFRKFEMKDGNFYLNGKPVFLRGNAINPPGRGIPQDLECSKEFARDYIRFLKGQNINIVRIPDNQNWMDVCDEEGMMIFAGRYGRPAGGTASAPPPDLAASVRRYKETDLGPFTSHPSVMIYILSNEMPYEGQAGDRYREFLRKVYEELIKWDHTRQYICNAGYGLGKSADIYDVHRYWGWYYNSFLTYLNLRDTEKWQNEGKVQAITFTECVGNYTGPDGRYNLCSRTKQPGSQKCWTGHLPESKQGEEALEYQSFILKNAIEMFRRLRFQNSRLSGIMPFTIMFSNWNGIHSFAEMKPKPVAYQYGRSYQPVLLSWELWQYNAIGGQSISPVMHIINDDDNFRDLTEASAEWRLEGINRECLTSGNISLPEIRYYGTFREKLEIDLPDNVQTGEYTLTGYIIGADGSLISENSTTVFIAAKDFLAPAKLDKKIKLYGKDTGNALKHAGIPYESITDLKKLSDNDVLVLSENTWDQYLQENRKRLAEFAHSGGRILCLRQIPGKFDWSWIDPNVKVPESGNNDPTYLSPEYTYVDGMNINIEKREHPVFDGLDQKDFRLWSDYTGFDESEPGFPQIYPVTGGFSMRDVDLEHAVIYANYSRNLSGTALAEFGLGKGSVIVSGFDLMPRCGCDPIARKLLYNLIHYAASDTAPEYYQKVGNCILWGNYESEKGLVTGANNGLVINPYPYVPAERRDEYPLKVDSRGYHYVVSYGGWNNRPGVQYLTRGRRPFAPFGYSAGGSDTVAPGDEGCGEGYFLATVPDGTDRMITTFENNSDEEIRISVIVNGKNSDSVQIPPHSQKKSDISLGRQKTIKVLFRGDRRTVILRTDFTNTKRNSSFN